MEKEELLIRDIIDEYDITEEECEIHKIVMNYLKERSKGKNWSNHIKKYWFLKYFTYIYVVRNKHTAIKPTDAGKQTLGTKKNYRFSYAYLK